MQEPGTRGFHVISIGSEVFTTDALRLGEVEDIRAGSFKVNPANQPDYWLPSDTVASIMGKCVTLAFTRDRLDHYKSSLPRAA
jgi:hypothetical protein